MAAESMLTRIGLQQKTRALPGTVNAYWFENEFIGLENTLFHRIVIPLQEFDSGLDWEPQPVSTEVILEWYELGLDDPNALDGLNLSSANYPKSEATLYVGCSHNWCRVEKLALSRNRNDGFDAEGQIFVEFEIENVALNEAFLFHTALGWLSEIPRW